MMLKYGRQNLFSQRIKKRFSFPKKGVAKFLGGC
jgi:hypothetical protein